MSRRAMIILIVAIVSVHAVLLGLFLATGSAERQLAETLREIKEETALRSEMETSMTTSSDQPQTEQTSSVPNSPASTEPAASSTPVISPPKTDPTANLPAVKEKPAPSVPSTTYVRAPKKTAAIKLDFSGAARDNVAALRGVNLATTGILVDMDKNTVLWAKNPSKPVPVASLTKIMTIMLAYEIALDDASPYTLESLIPVTTEPSPIRRPSLPR